MHRNLGLLTKVLYNEEIGVLGAVMCSINDTLILGSELSGNCVICVEV